MPLVCLNVSQNADVVDGEDNVHFRIKQQRPPVTVAVACIYYCYILYDFLNAHLNISFQLVFLP
jgi:hypothetical protein